MKALIELGGDDKHCPEECPHASMGGCGLGGDYLEPRVFDHETHLPFCTGACAIAKREAAKLQKAFELACEFAYESANGCLSETGECIDAQNFDCNLGCHEWAENATNVAIHFLQAADEALGEKP
jgi:hypothetical protein